MAELAAVRHSLAQVLGHNYPRYLRSLREWLAGKDSREDLELELPFLSDPRVRPLHNKFIKEILKRSLNPDSESFPTFVDQSNYFYDYSSHGNFRDYSSLLHNGTDNCITLHSAPGTQLSLPMSGLMSRRHQGLLDMNRFSLGRPGEGVYFEENSEPPPKRDLYYVEMSRVSENYCSNRGEDETVRASTSRHESRLPSSFMKDFSRYEDQRSSSTRSANLTVQQHIEKWVQKEPRLAKFFTANRGTGHSVLTADATVQGKFLARAWARGLKTVHPDAVALAVRATREHIRKIVATLVKRRKSYDLHNGAAVNIGLPYPNSYLLSGPHRVDAMKPPFTSRLVEPVQIPQLVESSEELERLSVMRHATSVHTQPRYESKIGCTELLSLIQSEPSTIPSNKTRHKLVETLLLEARGTFESPVTGEDEDMYDLEQEEGQLFPVCIY